MIIPLPGRFVAAASAVQIDDHRVLYIDSEAGTGDICTCYYGRLTDSTPTSPSGGAPKNAWEHLLEDDGIRENPVFIKTPLVCPGENPFLDNEVDHLLELYPEAQREKDFFKFLVKHRLHLDMQGRRLHVMDRLEGYVTLEEIHNRYPNGIDYRDAAWMFKRSLGAVGFANEHGFVHGAVLPPHLMVHPTEHGAKLIDWSYSVRRGRAIRLLPARYEEFYPPEVFEKKEVVSTTDTHLLGKTFIQLLGGDPQTNEIPDKVPEPIQKLLTEMVHPQPTMRPSNLWDLHEEFDKIIQGLVGRPKYRPFLMAAEPV